MKRVWKGGFLGLLLISNLALAQSAAEILDRVERNLATPWQALVQGTFQGPLGQEELQARVYAIPQERLFRIEFLKSASLEGNFTVITEREVWNYLYLTNQLVISPRERAQVQGLGLTAQAFGDLRALAQEAELRLVGEERLPEGPAWRLLGQARGGQGFAQVEVYVLKADPRPVRFLFRDQGGRSLADLRVAEFRRANLAPAGLKRYPRDAQVLRR
ncbi:outer membrane lipoprotein carrier protein LolA [Thermus sediminis]|uniref:outer membrane lipoprotein carrier protein LolA n=1 Tax=Thermus sediminis TaxID=1761908 RepID=UPI000E3BBEE1|nr:outer membrane lipoprotein carrier protein LolA [Thermus sediminis]